MRGSLLVLETNCKRKPELGEAAKFILQPQYTDNPQNICGGGITNALHKELVTRRGSTGVMRVFGVLHYSLNTKANLL